MSFPDATEHGPIAELFPDLFWVRGSMRPSDKMTFTRNMIIAREGDDLTIMNAVRLDADGERALEGLGTVRHLVKLGAFHGLDDPYYVDRYQPILWAPPDSGHKGGLTTDRELTEEACPLADAQVFRFRNTALPEAMIRVPAGGGTLLSCDAITNWIDTEHCRGVDSFITAENGLLRPASIGVFWRRRMSREHGPSLVLDYRRLLDEVEFDNLLTAHGPPLEGGAADALRETLRYLYRVEL